MTKEPIKEKEVRLVGVCSMCRGEIWDYDDWDNYDDINIRGIFHSECLKRLKEEKKHTLGECGYCKEDITSPEDYVSKDGTYHKQCFGKAKKEGWFDG